MAADTWQLMRLYWTLDWREGSGRSRWRIVATIAGLAALLMIGAASAAFGYGMSFLTRPEMPFRMSPGIPPGTILTFVLLGVLVSGLNQAVKSLFLSGDLDRLMVAPIHTRSVMVAKILSRLPTTVILLLLVATPALVAYGIGVGAGPVYYVLGLFLLLLAPLFGLTVGAIIAMIMVRLLPVNRLNELLAAAYAVLGIMLALVFQIPRFLGGNDAYESVEVESFGRVFAAIDRVPLPTLWAGRGLMALDQGRFDGQGLLGIGLFVALTLGLFIGLIFTADKLYLSGWLKTQSAGTKRRGLDAGGPERGGRSLTYAFYRKDWRLRLRDPRQLVNVLGSGIIAIVIGGLAIFRGGSRGDTSLMDAAAMGEFDAPGAFGFFTAGFSPGLLMAGWALFVGFMILSNTASYALAIEGRAFPLLKAAPVRPRDVWLAKVWSVFWPFLIVFVVVLILGWVFVRFSLLWMPYAVAVAAIVGMGLIVANVSTGFRFANLEWVDPRRMLTSSGGFVSLLLTLLYGIPASIVAFVPFGLAQVWPSWVLLFVLVGLTLLAGGTYAWFVAMQRWAETSWEKLPV